MQIVIRDAEVDDLDRLLDFEQGVIETERPFDPSLKRENTRYYDMAAMIAAPHIRVVVAELDGELIGSGYARIEDSKPYLTHDRHSYMGFMFTVTEHRGKGVNQKIIEALEQWSLSQGVTEMRLEVYADNLAAIRAYEKIGYSVNVLKMRKSLGGK
ncbi:MAG: GNAT family N-acetyltransferase [Pyrinomonadaceae bacterium]|nr:GNAT family N-acetyltransferase [Pyrinomonadaceae bacterium]